MNKKYYIGIVVAALLMMLPTVMEASAEPAQAGNAAPASAGVVESGGNSQEYASAIDPWCSTGPGGKCGPKEYWDRWGQEEPKMMLPIEDNLIDPIEVTLPVIIDPVIDPPQDMGNDVGPCVIGIPSPCNDPRYWLPERWNWDHWSHYKYRTPILIVPEPPIITLPVEPYELADANCYGGKCGFVEPGYYILPVEPESEPEDTETVRESHFIPVVPNQNSLSRDEIQDLPGVVATGITGSIVTGIGKNEKQLLVSLEEYNLKTISKLPSEVDGKRVVFDVIGPITAMPEEVQADPASAIDVQTDPIEPEHKEGTVSDSRKGEAAPAVARSGGAWI